MKKIITLSVIALTAVACDPFNDEPGGAPAINSVVVTGAGASTVAGIESGGVWTVAGVTPADVGTSGRIVIVTTNQLLDGESIEAVAGGCDPAGDWLDVTGTGADALEVADPTGQWFTCYYPSSATARDGASVFFYYSPTPPGTTAASAPFRTGNLVTGAYAFRGTILTKGGDPLEIAVDVTVN